MALPKQRRLKEPRIISRAFSTTRSVQESGISIRALDNKNQPSRFVVVVPAKTISHATRRNTIRRRVAEAIRRIVATMGAVSGKDVVVTVRTPSDDHEKLEKTLVLLMKKSGILQQ